LPAEEPDDHGEERIGACQRGRQDDHEHRLVNDCQNK
jgi:hypothetical protein